MNNIQISEIIFHEIRKLGYKPYNIEYGNSYFIFSGEDNSVIHFRLKGLGLLSKRWKFGLWIHAKYLDEEYREKEKLEKENLYKVVQLFAQYDTQIDKFKPSKSALCVEYDACDWNNRLKYKGYFWKLESMLGMIKRHPFMCYADYCGEYAGYYKDSFLTEFLKYESKEKIAKIREYTNIAFWLPYTKLKIFLSEKSNIVDNIDLYDFEKENHGWSTSYKYKVRIIFSENATDKQMCKWLDFWFKKEKYGEYRTYRYIIELDNFKQVGHEGSFGFSKK